MECGGLAAAFPQSTSTPAPTTSTKRAPGALAFHDKRKTLIAKGSTTITFSLTFAIE
jgi:hypothetical protein